MTIPYTILGESGASLHFLHANGYPPDCYRPLLTRLAEHYQVLALNQRPLWLDSKPEEIADWRPLTDDFLRYLDERQTAPSVCAGHSVGGIVLLRAALRQPERFRALVLIDPVLFPPRMIAFMRLIRALGLMDRLHPLIPGTLRRRRVVESRARLFNGYRHKPVFRYMSDDSLNTYIEGLTIRRQDGQYELVYSPEWEAHIYATGVWRDMDIWRALPKCNVPTLIIRGAETDTFWKSTARKVTRLNPSIRVETIEQATHLVALERPQEVAELILAFSKESA
jgi:pimeloyl-ACP methyl ester carboxylesterase